MKNLVLKKFFHRERWKVGLYFSYDAKLNSLVRSVPGIAYSGTFKCWYTDYSEESLKKIRQIFGEIEIDESELASDSARNDEHESSPVRAVKPSRRKSGESNMDEPQVEIPEAESLVQTLKLPVQEVSGTFDPVEIRLNEADGNVAVRFSGRCDMDWIDEIASYRNYRYDKESKEFVLPWSPVTVDSLSDYFASRGIEVNVIKTKVNEELLEKRKETGDEIRSRELGLKAQEALGRLKRHLEGVRYSNKTTESYLPLFELFLKYYNTKDPERISGEDVSDFVSDFIIPNGFSSSYQNLMISAIKMYFRITGRKKTDLKILERPKKSRALPKVFSKDEVKKILSASRNEKHKLILWMIYACGLRRSEIGNILLTDLDRKRNILHIRQGKGKVDRIVPVSDKIWEKIDQYIESYNPKKYLFEGQSGGRYSSESVYRVFKFALERSGINKEVGVHSLRHSYATHLHESGLDIRYIQELLGHKSTRTTEIYTHVSRRNLSSIRSPIEDLDIR